MTTYLTEYEIHVMGLQRTGQHALVAWVTGHFDKVCFRNSVPRKHDINLIPEWWYFDLTDNDNFTWKTQKEGIIKEGQDAIILGSEFRNDPIKLHHGLEKEKKEMANKAGFDEFSRYQYYLPVIRTPWNHLASVLSWKKRWFFKHKERFTTAYINMAREYLGITNNLPSPKIFIKYDDWFASKEYREGLSKQMGLPFSDKGLNIVMPIGWGKKGSSFDEMELKIRAQDMRVLERWKKYQNNNVEFKDVLKMRPELLELSHKIFGDPPFEI